MLHSFSKAASGGQTSLVKISDGSIKSVPASSQLSKPGTTVLRVSGGVITTAAAPAVALPTNGVAQVRNSPASVVSCSVCTLATTVPGTGLYCSSPLLVFSAVSPAAGAALLAPSNFLQPVGAAEGQALHCCPSSAPAADPGPVQGLSLCSCPYAGAVTEQLSLCRSCHFSPAQGSCGTAGWAGGRQDMERLHSQCGCSHGSNWCRLSTCSGAAVEFTLSLFFTMSPNLCLPNACGGLSCCHSLHSLCAIIVCGLLDMSLIIFCFQTINRYTFGFATFITYMTLLCLFLNHLWHEKGLVIPLCLLCSKQIVQLPVHHLLELLQQRHLGSNSKSV